MSAPRFAVDGGDQGAAEQATRMDADGERRTAAMWICRQYRAQTKVVSGAGPGSNGRSCAGRRWSSSRLAIRNGVLSSAAPPAAGTTGRHPGPPRRPGLPRTRTRQQGGDRSPHRVPPAPSTRPAPPAASRVRACCPRRAAPAWAAPVPAGHLPTAASRSCRCDGPAGASAPRPRPVAPRPPAPAHRSAHPAPRMSRTQQQAAAGRSQATMIRTSQQ
jgi:hypothetical protein